MPTLLLRLAGPMQSWGTTSRFDERDSQLEPSKSGVLGLVCAALGRHRTEPVDDLARLKMGVQVDREGLLMRDYQTIGGDRDQNKKTLLLASGEIKNRTVISPRHYLADAVFLVGLEGEDRNLLQGVHSALRSPVWPLALGRKSFPPAEPIWLPDALRDENLREALLTCHALLRPAKNTVTNRFGWCWSTRAKAHYGSTNLLRHFRAAASARVMSSRSPFMY